MKTAIAIAAHPDDIEFLMSGTLMQLADRGYQIHYWNLANGCCGTSQYDAAEIAAIRRTESMSAAEYLGATFHESICNDLEIFYDQPTLAKVASVIRQVAPEIILTHSPVDYMEDHTNTCRLAVTAAFSRGMRNFPVQPPHPPVATPTTIYHAQPYFHVDALGEQITPKIFVDVEALLDRKLEVLGRHQSQKQWLDESQGQDSYLKTLRNLDAEAGSMSGKFKYAEGWRRHSHMGFCDPNDCPLSDALGELMIRS